MKKASQTTLPLHHKQHLEELHLNLKGGYY